MEKKVIIISGSSKGIGYGLAEYFLDKGHSIVVNGRDEDKLNQAIDKLNKQYQNVVGLPGDISHENTHIALLKLAKSEFGKVDIYINNAGIPQGHKLFSELDIQKIKDLIDINLKGLMIGSHVAINFMKEQGFGKIFNLEGFGSDGRTLKKLTLYGTSKRAIQYFNTSLAKELEGENIQIGSINPGMVRTDFIKVSMEKGDEKEQKQFEKVKRIMAEDLETVIPVIAPKILNSRKNNDRIKFLSSSKLFIKILKMIFS